MKTRFAVAWGFLMLAAFGTGCAGSKYRYLPTEATEHTPKQIVGATYLYPPDNAESFIRVDAQGFRKVKVPGKGKVKALWVHLTLSNRDKGDWKVNLRDSRVREPGTKELEPVWVKADSEMLPWLTIPVNETRIADVFFEMPKGKNSLSKLPNFEFYWKVDVSTVSLNFWTPFAKKMPPRRARNLIGAPFLPGTQSFGPQMPGMR